MARSWTRGSGASEAGPRLTLAGLMGVVLVVAGDLAAFARLTTWGVGGRSDIDRLGVHFILGVLPIASVAGFLHLGILAGIVAGRDRPRPFATGFVAATPVALLGFAVASLLDDLAQRFWGLIDPITPAATPGNVATLLPLLLLAYAGAVSIPQFALACLGGWYFRRRGIMLVPDPTYPAAAGPG